MSVRETHFVSCPWKDKILDYEIEMRPPTLIWSEMLFLEKIRFSITRLKYLKTLSVFSQEFAWKDKILDYEIEISHGLHGQVSSKTWKDKILDYEIEIEK